MKKIIYSLVLAVILAASFTSCTEENIKPSDTTASGGGNGSTDPMK